MDSRVKNEPCVCIQNDVIDIIFMGEEEVKDQDNKLNTSSTNEETEWRVLMQKFVECQQSTMDLLKRQLLNKQANTWENKKFPIYTEGDDVSVYLSLFESVCKSHQIAEEDYIQILWSHTHGDLARLLQQVPSSEVNDYQKFKRTALQYFVPTESQLCRSFRSMQPQPGELYTAFMTRLIRAAESWWQAAGVETLQDLRDLVIKEQFLMSVPQETNVLMQANNSKDLMTVATFADQIVASQGNQQPFVTKYGRQRYVNNQGGKRDSVARWSGKGGLEESRSSGLVKDPVERRKSTMDIVCYYCSKRGHTKRNCIKRQQDSSKVNIQLIKERNASADLLGTKTEISSHLQQPGDNSRLNREAETGRLQDNTTIKVGTTVAMNQLQVLDINQLITQEQRAWVKEFRTEPVTVNHGLVIQATKDSGADMSSIKKSLLSEVQYEGLIRVEPYECTTQLIPVVKVHVKFRGYEGEQFLLVYEKSEYDFVIGADLLFKAAAVPNIQTSLLRGSDMNKIVEAAVQIRSQSKEAQERLRRVKEASELEMQQSNQAAVQTKSQSKEAQERSKRVRKVVSENLKEVQHTQKEHSDAKARPRIFQLGDKVLLLRVDHTTKLEVDWEGPFEIVQVLLFDNYLIQRVDAKEKPVTVHADRLKSFQERMEVKVGNCHGWNDKFFEIVHGNEI